MTDKTGGPAFPVSSYVNADGETFESHPQGMTLRDYFAAHIAQGMHSNAWLMKDIVTAPDKWAKRLNMKVNESVEAKHLQDWIANTAYQFADAMLKEREK